ncbi:MAG TPA: ATP-binding cassette domain-containing protein [Myxococcota bacterium]|nr:ATP-binding cassette domain-containing protein [Myxococcota bacterium]
MASEHLVFRDVHKAFDGKAVLRGASLSVRRGSVHFVLGRSGAGKSVLIKSAVGLVTPDAGEICLDGRNVVGLPEAAFRSVRDTCQLIFQAACLFSHLTVLENVAMPVAKRFHLDRGAARARAAVALAQVNAAHLAARPAVELGAGLQKRVAVARALALQPRVLLFDEPTTGLDPVAARRTDRLIATLAHDLGLTALVVSHDRTSVRDTADGVSFLDGGRIVFDGTGKALFASSQPAVRAFVAPG